MIEADAPLHALNDWYSRGFRSAFGDIALGENWRPKRRREAHAALAEFRCGREDGRRVHALPEVA